MKIVIDNKRTKIFADNDDKSKPAYEFASDDFAEALLKVRDPWITVGMMPPRLVWVNDSHTCVIFERPPFQIPMWFHYGKQGQGKKYDSTCYEVNLPWTVYGVSFDAPTGDILDMRIFARNTPVLSFDDPLFVLPIPNMMYSASCCLGVEFHDHYREPFKDRMRIAGELGERPDITLADRLSHGVNTFWAGVFNMDIDDWANPDRLPGNIPESVKTEGDQTLRSVHFLEWYAGLSRTESAALNYTNSNVFGFNGDTVAHLRDRLDLEPRKERKNLASNHKLYTRATRHIPGVAPLSPLLVKYNF